MPFVFRLVLALRGAKGDNVSLVLSVGDIFFEGVDDFSLTGGDVLADVLLLVDTLDDKMEVDGVLGVKGVNAFADGSTFEELLIFALTACPADDPLLSTTAAFEDGCTALVDADLGED